MTLRPLLGFALGLLIAFPLAAHASPSQRDPYVDVTGDTMEGDLVLAGPAGLVFDGGALTGAADGTLTWNGAPVCLVDACGALTAGHGLLLDGAELDVDTSIVQARVQGCAAGWSIRAVAQDGSVTCHQDADTDTDTLAALRCAHGEVPKLDAATTWRCAPDEVGAVTPGDGLDLVDDELSVDASVQRRTVAPACPAGHFLAAIAADGAPTCGADAVGETTSAAVLVEDNATRTTCSFTGGFFFCFLNHVEIGSMSSCTAVANITLTAPAAGVVLLDADVRLQHNHTEGTRDATRLTFSSCSFADAHTAMVETARALPTDTYLSNTHVSHVVPVAAGTRTYALNLQTTAGGSPADRLMSANLRAVFVPT